MSETPATGSHWYFVATDVGGTCTDTIVLRDDGAVFIGKALSTPPDFAHGVLDSIRSAAEEMGMALEDLFARARLFMHGSTVVDNTILTRDGARHWSRGHARVRGHAAGYPRRLRAAGRG